MFQFFTDSSNSSRLSAPPTDSSSHVASSSGSTPPTTVADSASQLSQGSGDEVMTDDVIPPSKPTVTHEQPASPQRPRRSRLSAPIYNLSKLSGTDGHGKRRANGDDVADRRRRRTISGDTLIGSFLTQSPSHKTHNLDAFDANWSPRSANSPRTRRQARESPRALRTSSRRITTGGVSNFGNRVSKITKRTGRAVAKGVNRISRELSRLQDTKEFAGLDDQPVLHTIWSNGKFVDPNEIKKAPEPKKSKAKPVEEEAEKEEPKAPEPPKEKQPKKYLDKGLYAGQEVPADIAKGLTIAEKKELAQYPELAAKPRPNSVMPPVLYTGFRMLIAGRDFKLPFLTCNPLPPGQPKPDEWKKMTKNRFIGDSKDYWRKGDHWGDYQSKCVCKPDDPCGEDCQNRSMLYECDEYNCNVGKEICNNRSFANLQARRAKGGKYRVGVEVIKTSDRGHGVRSNRCFRPHQIIMEYAGEIITEEECERRMREEYKHNDCYYLMSFDQNMIIDATTGSIARFVNHSCDPNCRMIKWVVSGQPRMALFAGDKPIMTGDELTYDYNFDPFSNKSVQKCLCGSKNCRGVLGPRPKEVRVPKTDLKKAVKATVKAGKRKLKEFLGDEGSPGGNKIKKRKIKPATGVKRTLSSVSVKAAKGAASALKKGISSITVKKAKGKAATKKPVVKGKKKKLNAPALLKKSAAAAATGNRGGRSVSGLSNNNSRTKLISASRSSSLTIVGMSDENIRAGRKPSATQKKTPASPKAAATVKTTTPKPRKVSSKKTTTKMPPRAAGAKAKTKTD